MAQLECPELITLFLQIRWVFGSLAYIITSGNAHFINPIFFLPFTVTDTAQSGTDVSVEQEPTFDRPTDAPSRHGEESSPGNEIQNGGEIGSEVETVLEVASLSPPSFPAYLLTSLSTFTFGI